MAEVKPVRAWGVVTPKYGVFPLTFLNREDAGNSTYMDNVDAKIVRVVILRESDYLSLVVPKRRAKKKVSR